MVPWGPSEELQLYLASVTGSIEPRRLAGPANHRLFGATLSADRRSLIYIDSTANEVRTMAVDGTGDRALFDRLPVRMRRTRPRVVESSRREHLRAAVQPQVGTEPAQGDDR